MENTFVVIDLLRENPNFFDGLDEYMKYYAMIECRPESFGNLPTHIQKRYYRWCVGTATAKLQYFAFREQAERNASFLNNKFKKGQILTL